MGFLDKIRGLFAAGPNRNLPVININKRFELIGRTGQGSMSKVWRARDRELGRVVCLKVLDRIKTQKFEARFPGLVKPSEGAVCVSLKHRNVVNTFEHGYTNKKEQFNYSGSLIGMMLLSLDTKECLLTKDIKQ